MANTVNDVMNVIASPDYGIKNIAGTNQEILAILSGNHNSKNNIHSLVDDVRNLLQTLVNDSTKKKPVEVDSKSAKINQKHIESILDETKSIRKSIDNLSVEISKQGSGSVSAGVVKLSDKASEKVADAMAKNIEKQNSGSGMAALADAFSKLKNISVKDLTVGEQKLKYIGNLFKDTKKDLNIDEKELKSINGLVSALPEMLKTILKVGRKANRIVKKEIVQKLSGILVGDVSILSIALALEKNEKIFDNANKAAKNIKELASALNSAMRKMLFAALWASLAYKGVNIVSEMLDATIPLATKLTKNKKDIETGTKAAKQMTTLIGNLLITSIFLTILIVTGLTGALGAKVLDLMVRCLIPVAERLSKKNKDITKAVGSSIVLIAFTGIMLITSLLLSAIASKGIDALLGSLVVLGIVGIHVITFNILGKAQKNIIKGAISMLILSVSLIFYGIALGLITKATKDVSLKQVIMIALLTGILVGVVIPLGIPQVFAFVALGAVALMLVGVAYIAFGTALSLITKATKNLTMKQILLVTGSMVTLAGGIAAMAIFLVPVILGSITLGAMSLALLPFVGALKIISNMKEVPTKKLHQVLNAMRTVGNFFKNNKVSLKAVWNAAKYMLIMPPFSAAVFCLSTLKKVGTIPMKLVYGALNAIRAVGNFFKNNKLRLKAIWNAAKYRIVMVPFSGAVRSLSKLKKLGVIPMKLVYGALNAMKTIGNFFKNNKIGFKAIWNAMSFGFVMGPFRRTVRVLSKLKELGVVPMKLVYAALNAVKTIANYYENNTISKEAIKSAFKYIWILNPFGHAIRYLTKLKELGVIPMKLVYATLNAIKTISEFYINQNLDKSTGKAAIKSSVLIRGIIYSFGKAVEILSKLKDMKNIPTEAVNGILVAVNNISWFYRTIVFSDDIEEKSEFSEYIVDKFTIMAQKIQDKFANLKKIDHKAVLSIVVACRAINDYYTFTLFFASRKKIRLMNESVRKFANNVKYLKKAISTGFSIKDCISVMFMVKAMKHIIKYYTRTKFFFMKKKVLSMNTSVKMFIDTIKELKEITSQGFSLRDYMSVVVMVKSLKRILRFLKHNSLNVIQRAKARKSISLLSRLSSVMTNLSGVNTSNISSIGGALTDALSGVNTVDMSQVEAVTNMFNAFNGINKSENIINKFTESVKEFTEACKNLMDAMSNNTDAINSIETGNISTPTTTTPVRENSFVDRIFGGIGQPKDIRIANVEEIAENIAEKINGALSVEMPDTQVQLLINGSGGNEWTITRY